MITRSLASGNALDGFPSSSRTISAGLASPGPRGPFASLVPGWPVGASTRSVSQANTPSFRAGSVSNSTSGGPTSSHPRSAAPSRTTASSSRRSDRSAWPKRSRSGEERWKTYRLGTHTWRTPTVLPASISLMILVASSTGCRPPRNAFVNTPSITPSRRRSNSFRIPKASSRQVGGFERDYIQGSLLYSCRTRAISVGSAVTIEIAPGEWRNWQTRRIQVPVRVTGWRFKSSLAHR